MDYSSEVYDTRIDGKPYTFLVCCTRANNIWSAFAYKGRPGSVPYSVHVRGDSSESAALRLVKEIELIQKTES